MSKKKVAQTLGLSRDTVRSYEEGRLPPSADRAAVMEQVEVITDGITKRLEVMVPEMLDAAREKIQGATFKDLLIGSGIGIEKLELLKGRPTSREGREVRIIFSADSGAGSLRELAERTMSGTRALPEPPIEGEVVATQD